MRNFFKAVFVLTALLIIFFLYTKEDEEYLEVVGSSMEPTFYSGQCIKVNEYFSKKDIVPGTIVVFIEDTMPNTKLIKRVIALNGDTVDIENNSVYVNGTEYKTKSIDSNSSLYITYQSTIICGDYVYLLGDNYNDSYDSRQFGPIPIESIIGIVKE